MELMSSSRTEHIEVWYKIVPAGKFHIQHDNKKYRIQTKAELLNVLSKYVGNKAAYYEEVDLYMILSMYIHPRD